MIGIKMRYLSLFSGIEAATVAWHPLGWECVAVSEIDKFPCQVLAHRYPNTPNLGDVTKITEEDIKALGSIDLVVFGSPCQDLSVAGKRRGLDGARSGLFFTAMRIVEWARKHNGCRFALWENVPGAFSSAKGEDFAAVVREMGGFEYSPTVPKSGWGNEGVALGEEALVEWSTLDAQWFGVAQRRRRVFALADFGDWFSRPPILLESESLRGDSAPSRGQRQEVTEVAGTLAANGGGLNRPAGNANELDFCVTSFTPSSFGNYTEGVGTLKAHGGDLGGGRETLVTTFDYQSNCEYGNGEVSHTLVARDYKGPTDLVAIQTSTDVPSVAHTFKVRCGCEGGVEGYLGQDEVAFTLATSHDQDLFHKMQVRRLTPKECERLQGFPDGWTDIPSATDSNRYKALGNSMAVPVMRWIGQSIDISLSKSLN